MVLTGDYHTHTPYSHGKNTVMENVCRAKEIGLQEIGIADHGFAHIAFGLRRRDLHSYKAECAEAERIHGIKVLVGIEANILGVSGKTDLKESDYEHFDVFLCGKHTFVTYDGLRNIFGYGIGNFHKGGVVDNPSPALLKRNTNAYINAIKHNPIDILSHLQYLCPANTLDVAKCAEDYGTYLELNAKKQHLSDDELMEIVGKTNVRFVIGSDAHSASRIGEIDLVKAQLERVHFPMDRIDNIDGRTPSFRLQRLKKGN